MIIYIHTIANRAEGMLLICTCSVSERTVVCITTPAPVGSSGFAALWFDETYVEGELMYTYNPDPTITSVKRSRSILRSV